MSGRDPIEALMKRAGFGPKNPVPLTRHPEMTVALSSRFRRVAQLLDAGDVLTAVATCNQAHALLEVLHGIHKQDQHEELRDMKCKAKQGAVHEWNNLIKFDEETARHVERHYRERRLTWIDTRPPYKAPEREPKPKPDATRFKSVFVALDHDAAVEQGLPDRFEFSHGAALEYRHGVAQAIERKLKDFKVGWDIRTLRVAELKGHVMDFPRFRFVESNVGRGHKEIGYRLASTTHPFQEFVDARDGKRKHAAAVESFHKRMTAARTAKA